MRTLLNLCAIIALTICGLASCSKSNLEPIVAPSEGTEAVTQPYVVSIYIDDKVGLDSTTFSFFDEEGIAELDDNGATSSITTRTVSSEQWSKGVVEITILSNKEPAYLQTPNGEGDGIYAITKEAVRTKGGADYVIVKLVR